MRAAKAIAVPLLAGLVSAVPCAAGAESGTWVASAASTRSGDSAEVRSGRELPDGAVLETAEDGGCALLVGQDAVMQMCGGTSLSVDRRDAPERPAVVRLDRGEVKLVVDPKSGEVAIEIHTPSAVATLRGAVVHASVDSGGVTTITSAANGVEVQSSDPAIPGRVALRDGEQVVVRPGAPPGPNPTAVAKHELSSLGECLDDFHESQLVNDVRRAEESDLSDLLDEDIPDGTLAQLGAATTAVRGLENALIGPDSVVEEAAAPVEEIAEPVLEVGDELLQTLPLVPDAQELPQVTDGVIDAGLVDDLLP